MLAFLAGEIGDSQVRNRGTIGGSVANSDPAADYPAAVIALGATVHTLSRAIAGDERALREIRHAGDQTPDANRDERQEHEKEGHQHAGQNRAMAAVRR